MVRNDTAALLRQPRFPKRLLTVAVASCFAGAPAWALDANNLTAVTGAFTASQNGSVLTLTTATDRTLAEAQQRFNVLANEQLRVLQPSSSSLFLLRVVPGAGGVLEKSVIDGSIYSNGQFWLQNAAGALIGKGAVIDTAGFLATSMAVRLDDFMAARLTLLTGVAGAGDVINQGTIKTSSGGSVYLVGANVSNEGLIETPGGETILAAGQTVNLIDTGTPGVKVEVTGAAGNATNLGEIVATAGRIGMAGVIVKNSGTLNASSVVSEGGRIFLKASKDAYVDGAGRIVATGTKGGKVEVLGERVAVMDQAQIDASGTNGGGTVLVGGDFQGKNAAVQNATITYFGKDASIKADATDDGDGGKVIVWADDTTRAYGTISARGGANGGDGGFVEVSGKRYLDFQATADTRAPAGQVGRLLLDPINITINNTADVLNGGDFATYGTGVFSPAATSDSTITWTTITGLLGASNVLISTYGGGASAGNIDVAGLVVGTPNWANSLTLVAHNNVTFNNTFWLSPSGAGGLNVFAGWNGTWSGTAWASTPNVTANTGVISVLGSYISLDTGALNFVAGSKIEVVASGTYSSGIQTRNGGAMNLSALGTAAGTGIFVDATAVTANNRSAFIESSGNQSLSGYDIEVRAANTIPGSFSEAHIRSAGTQTISGSRLKLVAGATGSGNRATLESVGNQSITLSYSGGSALLVQGGGAGNSDYGNVAKIEHTGAGNQSITLTGNGAVVEIRGGDGYGLMPAGYWSGECSTAGICSGNDASIYNASGSQSIAFSGAGGYLNLYGGGGAGSARNSAQIENKGTGTQSITGSANISMYGGTAGGRTIVYGGKIETLDNGADIDSKYGSQTISAASLYMSGGTATYGGAYLSAPTQNLTIGSVTLVGGTGTAPGGYDIYGDVILTNPVIIGNDVTNTINLNVGSLSMQGGTSSLWGGSWALIGGYRVSSNVNVTSSGNIAVVGGGSQWSSRIGSLGGYGGNVVLASTGGTVALDNGYVGTGATGSVTVSGYGGVSNSALGRIETDTLAVNATQAGASIALAGEGKANYTSATAPGNITYIAVAPTHFSSVASTAGNISLSVSNLYGYGGWVGLGSLTATNGTIAVSAAQQILDDNGSGVGNLTAQGITLSSANGTAAVDGLAISADVVLTGGARTISASVSGAASNGGISLRNGSSLAPLSVTMTDTSTAARSAGTGELTYLSSYDIDMTAGAYNLSSNYGGAIIGSSGNITLSNLATLLPGINDAARRYIKISGQNVATGAAITPVSNPDLYINANGTLNVTFDIGTLANRTRNLGMNAVGGLSMVNADAYASADAYLGGVNNYGGGMISLDYGSAVIASGSIYGYTGGDIKLNRGSSLMAGYNVNLGLGGTASTVYLNDTTGYSRSYIAAGAGYTTNIGFPGRSADGVVIDGATTMTSVQYGSGIFSGMTAGGYATPATPGAGLNVVYGVAAAAAINQTVTDVVNTITTTTTTAANSVSSGTTTTSTANIPPPTTTTTTTSGGIAALGSGTVGGAAGQFGDTASSTGSTTTSSTTTTSTSGSTTSTTSGTTSGDTSSSTSSTTTTSTSGDSSSSGSTSTASSTSSSGEQQTNGTQEPAKEEKKEEKKDDKKKDDKKADSGEKKDDKAKSKPVGKCSA